MIPSGGLLSTILIWGRIPSRIKMGLGNLFGGNAILRGGGGYEAGAAN